MTMSIDPSCYFVSFCADAYDSVKQNGLLAAKSRHPFIRAAKSRLEAKLAYERFRPSSEQNKMRIVAVSPSNTLNPLPYGSGVKLDTQCVPPQHLQAFFDGNAVGTDLLEDAASQDLLVKEVREGVVYMAVPKSNEAQVLSNGFQPQDRSSVPVSLTAAEARRASGITDAAVLRLDVAKLRKDLLHVCREPRGYCVSTFARAPGNAVPSAPLLGGRHFLQADEDPCTFVLPSEVRFTQDSISGAFRDGTSLLATVVELASREIEKRDIEMVRIVWHNGAWYTLDNRRLACFRLLEMCGRVRSITCRVLPMEGAGRDEIRTEFIRKLGGGGLANLDPMHGKFIRVRGEENFVIGCDRASTSFGTGLDSISNVVQRGESSDADARAFMTRIFDEA